MKQKQETELEVIQKARDLILWYVPFLSKLPRDHKFTLGDRITTNLYDLLDDLIKARYSKQKLGQLDEINMRLELLRQQTRLLLDLKLMDARRYQLASKMINEVGVKVGGWIRQQKEKGNEASRKSLAPDN